MSDPLDNMRGRAEQYRRWSRLTLDRELSAQLRQWADEVEADIEALLSEREARYHKGAADDFDEEAAQMEAQQHSLPPIKE
jgi:hypothetical protein